MIHIRCNILLSRKFNVGTPLFLEVLDAATCIVHKCDGFIFRGSFVIWL
jgi:hypothetical protein